MVNRFAVINKSEFPTEGKACKGILTYPRLRDRNLDNSWFSTDRLLTSASAMHHHR